MKIYCLTWNIHNHTKLPKLSEQADIFIFSLQESLFTPTKKNILNSIDSDLKPYPYIYKCSMFQLKTIIVSKHKLQVDFYRIGQGPLGFLNKGFITSVINKSIAHINCHLEEHDHNYETRLKQLTQILSFAQIHRNTIILTGDFNFRSLQEAKTFKNKFPMLKENTIQFRPTYKYNGKELSPTWTPAHCDRVMYASVFSISSLKYDSLASVTSSDHKPVFNLFELNESIKLSDRIPIELVPKKYTAERIRTRMFLVLLTFLPFILLIIFVKLSIRPARKLMILAK